MKQLVIAVASLSVLAGCSHIGRISGGERPCPEDRGGPSEIDVRKLLPQQDPSRYPRLRSRMTTADVKTRFSGGEWTQGIEPPSHLKPLVIEEMPYSYVRLYVPLDHIEQVEEAELSDDSTAVRLQPVGRVVSVTPEWSFVVFEPSGDPVIDVGRSLLVRRRHQPIGKIRTLQETNGVWVADVLQQWVSPIKEGDTVAR